MSFFKKIFSKNPPEINEPAPEDRQPENKPGDSPNKPWIGVDLDGTLARDEAWQSFEHIGAPVPVMLARVKNWLAKGITVKILTARATYPDAIPPIKKWLVAQGLPELEVVSGKDFDMIELWDDRAVQVVQNTGRPFLSPSIFGRPRAPILPDEAASNTFYTLSLPAKKDLKSETPEAKLASEELL